MKRILTVILVLAAALALALAPQAAKIENLESIYAGLSVSIYKPYYENSPYYEEFSAELERLAEFLKSREQSQEEIDRHHEAIRSVFAALMHSTFDYSALEAIRELYDSMDFSLFTAASKEALDTAYSDVLYELRTPTVFQRGTYETEESYRTIVQDNIDSVEKAFYQAYCRLDFQAPEGEVEAAKLKSILTLCQSTARESALSEKAKWKDFETAGNEALFLIETAPDNKALLTEHCDKLLKSYRALVAESLNWSPVSVHLNNFATLVPSSYVSSTWSQYVSAVLRLENVTERFPPFLRKGRRRYRRF